MQTGAIFWMGLPGKFGWGVASLHYEVRNISNLGFFQNARIVSTNKEAQFPETSVLIGCNPKFNIFDCSNYFRYPEIPLDFYNCWSNSGEIV